MKAYSENKQTKKTPTTTKTQTNTTMFSKWKITCILKHSAGDCKQKREKPFENVIERVICKSYCILLRINQVT